MTGRSRGKGSGARWLRVISVLALVFLLCEAAVNAYISDCYHPSDDAIAALQSDDAVAVAQFEDGDITFEPKTSGGAGAGIIFYPGGKVQTESYAPLCRALAQRGLTCVLVHMPSNLAVLDPDAAADAMGRCPQVTRWCLAGHSLGGSMAARFAATHPGACSGLILLASYSVDDLSGSSLPVLSLYGSCDGVMDRTSYEDDRRNLPVGFDEAVIEGGNHAQFGSYGVQAGDGIATITPEQQVYQTADLIARFAE